MFTILLNLMDATYDDLNNHYSETREEMNVYLNSEDSPIKKYDQYVSILEEIRENRHESLFRQLHDISSRLLEGECVYIRFIGHCGYLQDSMGNRIDEIEDFHLNSFITDLFHTFAGKRLFINLLGSCCSCIALPYFVHQAKQGYQCALLYTNNRISDQYSPDNYLIYGYVNDGF